MKQLKLTQARDSRLGLYCLVTTSYTACLDLSCSMKGVLLSRMHHTKSWCSCLKGLGEIYPFDEAELCRQGRQHWGESELVYPENSSSAADDPKAVAGRSAKECIMLEADFCQIRHHPDWQPCTCKSTLWIMETFVAEPLRCNHLMQALNGAYAHSILYTFTGVLVITESPNQKFNARLKSILKSTVCP